MRTAIAEDIDLEKLFDDSPDQCDVYIDGDASERQCPNEAVVLIRLFCKCEHRTAHLCRAHYNVVGITGIHCRYCKMERPDWKVIR